MVSIIIPVYNCENYLTGCLTSIANQSFADFEVICIDDGSKDGSSEILDAVAKRDARIKVWHIENHGQAYARNLGIEKSSGELLCFIDADDEVDKEYLMKLVSAQKKQNADLVVCGMKRVFKKKANFLEKSFQYYPETISLDDLRPSIHPELLFSIINAPYCKLIRKSFLDEHQIRFLEGKIYEDFYFTQIFLMHDPKIVMIEDKLYNYQIYQGSTMTSKNSKIHDMYDVMDQLLEAYHQNHLFETFKDELEYLCAHHICIGTVYRSFMNQPMHLLKEMKSANDYLEKYGFSVRNKYCQKKQLFVRIYLNLFFR